ncbi:Uncharacterised protein [Streptococcus pyogenes]|nr:Uncharacterised protein [Streptococcus pyogenes]VGR47676.1 Uncharacterised protein [Streptococcus pyogenes]
MLSIRMISDDVNSSSHSSKKFKKSINRLEYSPPLITISSSASSLSRSLSSSSLAGSASLMFLCSSMTNLSSLSLAAYISIKSVSSFAYSLILSTTLASSLARPRLARILVILILSSTRYSVLSSLFFNVKSIVSPIKFC